jgi:hypothetical protein
MSNGSGTQPNGEGSQLTNLIQLVLPILVLQRSIVLTIGKSLGTNKDEHVKVIANFVALVLHTLMMTLDPTGKLRGGLDDKLEEQLKARLTQLLEKAADGLITVLDLQEQIHSAVISVLNLAKDRKRPTPQ